MDPNDFESLRAQLNEDEQVARDAGGRNWRREAYGCVVDAAEGGIIVYSEGAPSREQADHIARHDPARVLRGIEVIRRILDELEQARRTVAEREAGMCDAQ